MMTHVQKNPFLPANYQELPGAFYREVPALPVKKPELLIFNTELATQLSLPDNFADVHPDWLSGCAFDPGQPALALAYAGHQFGQFAGLLGDGRAALLGQTENGSGLRHDVQLKGSGPTPFARGGDGRAPLGAVVREYLISEAMAGLGLPTTRSLAIVKTGENVLRQFGPEPGGILTRTARSHIRVGTFELAARLDTGKSVKALFEFVHQRYFAELSGPREVLREIIRRQAELIAGWLSLGFIHGVMNTDNMSIVGETIDYGPCAFLDDFIPDKVFSSIDRQGRYAFMRQPEMALWNLTRLAETLVPLFDNDTDRAIRMATVELQAFQPVFEAAFNRRFAAKFGIANDEHAPGFIQDSLKMMAEARLDFTLFFRRLTQCAKTGERSLVLELAPDADALKHWLAEWAGRRHPDAGPIMAAANPVYIARNHRVEQAIKQAEDGDMAPFLRLAKALKTPFAVQEGMDDLELPPRAEEEVRRTFCGT